MRRSTGLLALGALLLVLVGSIGTYIAFRADETFGLIVDEREMRRNAADLLSALQDTEIGQRGFIVTQDQAFLAPYEDARNRVPRLADTLLPHLPEHGEADGAELRQLVERRLELAEITLADVAEGGIDRLSLIGLEGEGRATMDRIREILTGVLDRSDARNAEAIARQERLNRLLQIVSVVGGLATLVVIGGAFLEMSRQLRALGAAEEEMRRLNAGLEERVQQRTVDLMRANQEVQRFAYIVTHDLRAPLVNIMGFTSELETALKPLQAYVLADGAPISESDIRDARLAAAEDLPEALGFIRSSTRKMDGLINAILKISRDGRRELKPAPIDLKALAELTAATVQHQISDMDGSVEIDVTAPEIIGDRLSLEQALGNLVDNAVKYAHPDRPLRLKIRAYREDARMVRIDVSDNGRGISGDDHDRVFELFRRAGAQDRPGEGIGLAHVRTLMRNLGGEITLQSVAGQGSTFTLHVPADLRPVLNEVKL
ncbi:sensor histidine kinase [Cereibacter changlensis]|uniref:sensor histidine kinase n=1 Tax=Cereibacter changlensis TaxID=402884 RepID=UPI004033C962